MSLLRTHPARSARPLRVPFALALCTLAAAAPAGAANYQLRQEVSAIPSGEGAPNGVFGYSVAIDGDRAVAADLGNVARPGKVRTYVRSNGIWARDPDHDLDVPGDSSAMLSLQEDTLALTAFDSSTSRSYLQIYEYASNTWELVYSVSSQSVYFDRVATSGGIVVAGQPGYDGPAGNDQGRIRIVRRTGPSSWTGASLLPTTPEAGARFGEAVAIVAGAIVVGAPNETVAGYYQAGAAYVYELTIDTWNEVAHLVQGSSSLAGHRFGSAVAISGADLSTPDRLLVGSPSRQGWASGSVHSYTRTNGTWTARTILEAPSPSMTDGWGCALALDGDWAAIGQCDSDAQANDAGAVEMVHFTSGFTSVAAASIDTDPFAGAGEHLGYRIDVDRDGPTLIVGNAAAPMYGNPAQGVVLLGAWSNDMLALSRAFDLGQGLSGAHAATIASDGDTLFVGAASEDVGLQQERGAVYAYRRIGGQYVFESRILAPDGMAGDFFGSRIALQGDVALISAIGRTQGAVDNAGAVYAFHREGTTWALERQFLPVAPQYEENFGIGLALDGGTAMIGSAYEGTFVHARSGAGVWTPVQTIDRIGWSIALEGDTAMLAYFGANDDAGDIGVYARTGGSWQPLDGFQGLQPGQGLGIDTSLRGDWFAAASNQPATPVQLYRHAPNGWLPEASLLPEDATPDTWCWHVAMAVQTLAIGCGTPVNTGAVYLFEKIAGLWTQQQKLELPDPRGGDVFGVTLDFRTDGTLFAGAFGRDLEFPDQGAVYAWAGDRLFADGFDGAQHGRPNAGFVRD